MTPGSGRSRTPSLATGGLTGALAVSAGLLARVAGDRPLPPAHVAALALLLAALFAAVELGYVSVEFRRQTCSFTLSGVPLVLGLLSLPVGWVVAARLLGAAPVLLRQRLALGKTAYNLAAYGFEVALAGWLMARSGLVGGSLTPAGAIVTYGTLLVVDLLMTTLVLGLIRVHGGDLSRSDVAAALVPGAVFNAVGLALALVAEVLLERGPLGWALLAALTGVTVVAYRAHTRLAARHSALAQVGEFVDDTSAADTVEGLAGQRLVRVRALLGAGTAQVVLAAPGSDTLLQLTVDGDDVVAVAHVPRSQSDWLFQRVQDQDDAVLLPRGVRDPGLRRWLADRGARDGIVVPLTHGEGRGALLVLDRQADHSTFTADDVTLLRALAGHLGVALGSTRLLQRLRHDATHDVLTGLANRALLQERLDAALERGGAAVLLLDLDGFKEVNDALGHPVGDRLLQVVADRLAAALPAGATVARLGGDEFAALLPAALLPTGAGDLGAWAAGVGAGLASTVVEPVVLEEGTLSVAASIGVATSEDGSRRSDVLRHADTAMYAAKTAGCGVQRYSIELDRGRAERLALIADLRLALERDELVLRYQPKVDVRSGQVTSAEALVRWQHPRLGLLAPDVFIPLAEATGLVGPLTRVVLAQALRACRGWWDDGLELAVAVNLSARNVQDPDLTAVVLAALDDAGLPPAALVLEITESAVMDDPGAAVAVLTTLVDAGVTLSLDDFGTGYSSLAYLQRLPVQEVKIDKSFVSGLGTATGDRASAALVASIVGLGRSFGLRVVAEGVEDEATLARLTELGCDVVQGYLLGRPAPAPVLADLARARRQAAGDVGDRVPRQGPVRLAPAAGRRTA